MELLSNNVTLNVDKHKTFFITQFEKDKLTKA